MSKALEHYIKAEVYAERVLEALTGGSLNMVDVQAATALATLAQVEATLYLGKSQEESRPSYVNRGPG